MISAACRTFRNALSERLLGNSATPGRAVDLTDLSWSEHLLACDSCRDLLEAEEALEILLASLPDPTLPPALVERVLARLGLPEPGPSGDPLDELLDRKLLGTSIDPVIPVGLSGRVLRAVRERTPVPLGQLDDLDRLLDGVPEPVIPAGLSGRVIVGLESEYRTVVAPNLSMVRAQRLRRLVAAGVLVIGGAFAWRVLATGPELLDQELLAHLDTLENWDRIELLSGIEREALTLNAADELILELGEQR